MRIIRSMIFYTAMCFLLVGTCHAFQGKIMEVSKGDTVTVSVEGTVQEVRLYGVMCPVRGQPFYDKARDLVRVWVLQKNAEIIPVFKDSDGMTNALVRVEASQDYVNSKLISFGMAWVKPLCRGKFCVEWKRLESLAQQNGVGLWSESPSIPPWEWEKAMRQIIRDKTMESKGQGKVQ